MTWRCPACGGDIHPNEAEDIPLARTSYRCHLCRIELVVDQEKEVLVVASGRAENDQPAPRRSHR